MIAIAALAVVLIVGFAARARYLRALAREVSARRALGPDGIVLGGSGFSLSRPGAPAVLLIHGAGDTPQTLRYLGEALFSNGFHVEAPLLPGHGRALDAFMHTSADEWMNATRAAYRELIGGRSSVGVVGLSMGGALAARLAAEAPGLGALCLIAPYLSLPPRIAWAARTARWWGGLLPVFESSGGISILDPEERTKSLSYGVFTAAALRALQDTVVRANDVLGTIKAPTLMIQSRGDNRIAVSDAEQSFARIGAEEKRLEWVSGAAHIITVDYGRDHVNALVGQWLADHQANLSH